MGLNAALKDRARIIERIPLPERVDGKTVTTPAAGPWFRVRLELPAGDFTAGPGDRRRVVKRPTLLVGRRDEMGNDVKLNARQQLEVDAPRIGENSVWELQSDPHPITKKVTLIGWEATLRRVENHDFEPRIPPGPLVTL